MMQPYKIMVIEDDPIIQEELRNRPFTMPVVNILKKITLFVKYNCLMWCMGR